MVVQKNQQVVSLANPVANMVVTRIQNFTRINDLVFYGSKLEEDPQEFLKECVWGI